MLFLIFCIIESLMNLYYVYQVFNILSFQQLSFDFQINIFFFILISAFIILSIVVNLLHVFKVLVIVMCCCQNKLVCFYQIFVW